MSRLLDLARIFGGLLLCAAAVTSALDITPDENAALVYAKAAAELVAGLWLLSGIRRSVACLVGACLYFSFAVANAYFLTQGRESCGCFGAYSIDPAAMALLDTALAVSLVFVGVDHRHIKYSCSEHFAAVSGGTLVLIGCWLLVGSNGGANSRASQSMDTNVRVGTDATKLFELDDLLSDQEQWSEIVVWNQSCSACVHGLEELIRRSAQSDGSEHAPMIAVAPVDRPSQLYLKHGKDTKYLSIISLKDSMAWKGPTPSHVVISGKQIQEIY